MYPYSYPSVNKGKKQEIFSYRCRCEKRMEKIYSSLFASKTGRVPSPLLIRELTDERGGASTESTQHFT
jgi:hypothetical protein